jgi:hypothetical protein
MLASYKQVSVPLGHPLRTASSPQIGEHRLLLWRSIGPGTHLCHHCGRPVTWLPGNGSRRGSLVVDHLDEDITNNDWSNLVPSCHPCNTGRVAHKGDVRDDEKFVVKTFDGTRIRADEATCDECGQVFRAPRRRDKPQRFCSRRCFHQSNAKARAGVARVTSYSVRDDELYITHKSGSRARAVQIICKRCKKSYLVQKIRANQSKYCSLTCSSNARYGH